MVTTGVPISIPTIKKGENLMWLGVLDLESSPDRLNDCASGEGGELVKATMYVARALFEA